MQRKVHSILVAVNFTLVSGRNFFAGVLRYARQKYDWRVHIVQSAEFTAEAVRKYAAEGLDGIITTELENPKIRAFLDRSTVPLVAITSRENRLASRQSNLTYVNVDEFRIGSDAAAYFDTLGNFMTYAYVRHSSQPYKTMPQEKSKGFRAAILASGRKLHTFDDPDADLSELAAWLQGLPKPVALYTGRDSCALKVLNACHLTNLRIPQQVSILGTDNDELCCMSSNPPLSSMTIGTEDEGYAAAAELEKLLNGRHRNKVHEVICPTTNEVIERGSTASVKPATELIRRALVYIESHLREPLSVPTIVNALGVSRRLLELRFREILGESIGATILRLRLERLSGELQKTAGPMSKICRSCGFKNLAYAKAAFKRRFGMTMGDWRRGKRQRLWALADNRPPV